MRFLLLSKITFTSNFTISNNTHRIYTLFNFLVPNLCKIKAKLCRPCFLRKEI